MVHAYKVTAFSVVLVLASACASAATVSISATAPAVNGADIAQLTGASDIGGDEGHIWSNRPVQGQTFTTSYNYAGYTLRALTLKNLNNTLSNAGGAFSIQVGTVAGTVLTPLASETTPGSLSYVPNDYITATLAAPVALAPNTLHGFDWGSTASGFVTVNNLDSNGNLYAGGTAYSSGSNHVPNNANLLARAGDRVFHLDISSNLPRPALEYAPRGAAPTVINDGLAGGAGNLTLSGAAALVSGHTVLEVGTKAISIPGSGVATASDIDALDTANDLTLSFWVRPNGATGSWQDMMSDAQVVAGNNVLGWTLQAMASGQAMFRVWNGGNNAAFTAPSNLLVGDQWQQIAIVARNLAAAGTHTINLDWYRNGALFSSQSAAFAYAMGNGNAGFRLGDVTWDGQLNAQYAGIELFAGALDADAIRQNFQAASVPEPASLTLLALSAATLARYARRRRQ